MVHRQTCEDLLRDFRLFDVRRVLVELQWEKERLEVLLAEVVENVVDGFAYFLDRVGDLHSDLRNDLLDDHRFEV